MNERIRELAEQAKKYALDAMIKITDKEQALKVYSESYDKKFAELIVRECARVIDHGDGEMSSMAETIWCNVCRDDILKHFGVEE